MRTKVIKAESIDAAAERILEELKEDDATTARSISSRNNVIYFDGWDGLGASAVLRAVARRLIAMASSHEAPAGLQFDQIIHIDCAKWESRRALQRAIAEQLKLPAHVMEMFDTQDAEDDYNGVAKESRAEIPQIVREMYMYGKVTEVLLIFHNGSNEEIDMASFCGFPLSGYSTNKMLWSFQGRFRLCPRIKVDKAFDKSSSQGAATDVFLSAVTEQDPQAHWSYLVLQEAEDLVAAARKSNTGHGGIIFQPRQQVKGDIGSDEDDDAPWRAAEVLQREMRLDVEYWQHNLESLPSCLLRDGDRIASMPYWTSPPYEALLSPLGDKFQQFDKLGVLKLSRCTFSFLSPPFHSCNNLRVLWLDHCKDQVSFMDGAPEKIMEEDIRRLFQRLWVLDLCYSRCDRILSAQMIALMTQLRELNVVGAHDWDIGQLQGRLPNIRKLRVTKSTVRCSGHSEQDLFQGMNKMELLDFSGNHTMQGVSKISTSKNSLETVIIVDGWVGLQKLSLRGCAKLKNLLLSGLFEDLCILDLSGTAVKTLDLSAMTARRVHELILDNCDKLCAILWPPEDKRNMDLPKVHIDATQSASTSRSEEEKMKSGTIAATKSSWPMVLVEGAQPPSEFNWYISIKDARLLRSFVPSFGNYFRKHHVRLEISSPRCCPTATVGTSENEGIKNGTFVLSRLCPPPSPRLDPSDCYLYTQDQRMKDGGAIATIPSIICDRAYILHVHDSLYNTSIPGPVGWDALRWCQVERCPRLDFIFAAPQLRDESSRVRMCYYLRTFWASQLPRTRFMWDTSKLPFSQIAQNSFEDLTLLHLDFCPRLILVLPFSSSRDRRLLEVIEIEWCDDLRVVFPLLDTNDTRSHQEQQQKPPGAMITMVDFPKLRHIHLHELPMLESICGLGRMYAPNLQTIIVRGCWSLRHLPAVSSDRSNNKVQCDCEKEWWDNLEWDGLGGQHHPSLYSPVHSRYYNKKLLRGSVLR